MGKITTLNNIIKNAESTPNKLAIFAQNESVTYKELVDYAYYATEIIHNEGVKPGDFVSIELPRIWQYIGLCLAAWMCGAAFIASGTEYPIKRRDFIANNCNAKIRIDENYLKDKKLQQANNHKRNINIDNFPQLSDPAFAIYTSGSTGNPKGVIHDHESLLISCIRHIDLGKLSTQDRWASPAAFSFITGIISVISCIMGGASCYIVPDEARKNLNLLSNFTSEHSISIIFLPPAIIPYFKQKRKTIRTMFTGSERAINVYSNEYEIINCWGPTEMCNIILAFHVDRPYQNTPIGLPIGKEKAYILDENNNEVEEGELCIAGHMATEYIGLPEASKKVFKPNPFKDKDGYDIIIHSGDKVRKLEDGNIEFIERYDWMVNINGQRVEPGEIASTIAQLPQILKCEVVSFIKKDKSWGLCAYYQSVAHITENEIINHLSKTLPEYMIPEKLISNKNLPLLPNGKINRNLLPNPFLIINNEDMPKDNITATVIKILSECSGRNDYSYDEDLTKTGISSLTAIKLLATIDEKLGVTISLQEISNGCSIKSIVEKINSLNNK